MVFLFNLNELLISNEVNWGSTISYSMIMHIGSSEGITLLEFNEEEEEEQPETPQAVAPKGEEKTLEDLPECLVHRPTYFLKGKPRSILSLPCFRKYYLSPLFFMHYVIRVDWKHLMHRTTLSSYIYI